MNILKLPQARFLALPFFKFASSPQTPLPNSFPTLPIRIPFQSQNLRHIDDVFSLRSDQQTLQKTHNDFLSFLSSDREKGKQRFEHFQNSTKDLYEYIKTQILKQEGFSPQSEFIKRSHYYFQTQGKKIRPTMVNMMAASFPVSSQEIARKVEKWGAMIEMMHISSLAHDDIIDDSPSRRGVESQHLKYGKRSAVFSANFIIGKASKSIYDFNSSKLYQIYSVAMDNLATGEIIQAVSKANISLKKNLKQEVETYVHKSYYKTAALMANALRGVPVFFDCTQEQELASFRVGQHFGLAFQLVDDIIDYTSTAEQMGKENLADIAEGNITGPVYFSLLSESLRGKQASYIISELRSKKKFKEKREDIQKWVLANSGVELTFALADLHIERGLDNLKSLPNNNLQAWKYLGYKILSRRK